METSLKMSKDINDGFVHVTLYKHITGLLRYLCSTRPNIYQSVSLVSKFMEKFRTCHLLDAKRILRYIKVTTYQSVLTPNQKNTIKKAMTYDYFDSD